MYILEYTKTINENGERIPFTENVSYQRYGNIIYNSYEEADQDRIIHMRNENNIYIRVSEF